MTARGLAPVFLANMGAGREDRARVGYRDKARPEIEIVKLDRVIMGGHDDLARRRILLKPLRIPDWDRLVQGHVCISFDEPTW